MKEIKIEKTSEGLLEVTVTLPKQDTNGYPLKTMRTAELINSIQDGNLLEGLKAGPKDITNWVCVEDPVEVHNLKEDRRIGVWKFKKKDTPLAEEKQKQKIVRKPKKNT